MELPKSLESLSIDHTTETHDQLVRQIYKQVRKITGPRGVRLSREIQPQLYGQHPRGIRITQYVTQLEINPKITKEKMQQVVALVQGHSEQRVAGVVRRLLVTLAKKRSPLVRSKWFESPRQEDPEIDALKPGDVYRNDGTSHLNGVHAIGVYHTGPETNLAHAQVTYVRSSGAAVTAHEEGQPPKQLKKKASTWVEQGERLFIQIVSGFVEK